MSKLKKLIPCALTGKTSQKIGLWLAICVFFSSWIHGLGDIILPVPEELPDGTLVGNLNTNLGIGIGKLIKRELSVDFGESKQYLFISPENGNVFINERIDREVICGTKMTCYISLQIVMKHPFQLYGVIMEILDINDNAPTFPDNDLHFDIMESVPVGTVFPIHGASDQDVGSNDITIYRLSANDHFSLDLYNSSERKLMAQLVLDTILDREEKSVHHLSLIAIDGGEPVRSGTLEIVIKVLDANDNSPVFEKPVYKVNLEEDAPIGTLLVQVKAIDLDEETNGHIVYSFSRHTSNELRDKFNINPSSGEICLKHKMGIAEIGSYELHIQATDKGIPALTGFCKVIVEIIDVNNNAPEIIAKLVSRQIMEDAEIGTVVALISATDKDSGINAIVNCRIGDDIPFKLRSVSKYYTMVTDGPLDREAVSSHNITITAIDSGSPPLSSEIIVVVQIGDVNDNPPRFSQELYKVYLTENNSVGDFICRVMALDPDLNQNGRIAYSILDTELEGLSVLNYASISNENGNLYARSVFDYEKQHNFEILIEARDQGNPALSSTATVQVSIVDQNDNPPMFLYPPTTEGYVAVEMVPRSAEVGFLVTKVITVDADSGQNAWLSYQLLHASDTSLVSVDGQTGEIKILRHIRVTDPNKHRLIIQVMDNGTPKRTASVTIGLWLYDTYPQVPPDFRDSATIDSQDSNLNIYLVIAVVSISFLFMGFLIIVISLLCYKHGNATELPCLSVCCDYEYDKYGLELPVSPNPAILTDLDAADSETLARGYHYKAFIGFVSQNTNVAAVNCTTGGNNVTSEGCFFQTENMDGNLIDGCNVVSNICPLEFCLRKIAISEIRNIVVIITYACLKHT
ncbi:protocadherin beta-16-like [Protopterus annectens]|uniref:protocadherin beta-16-like n=1 Tax=Protopterus annectens TaxID=7888 RepID=UPI001CFA0FDD|nr:protocadherin beta-16-like [Protopterus annectens]